MSREGTEPSALVAARLVCRSREGAVFSLHPSPPQHDPSSPCLGSKAAPGESHCRGDAEKPEGFWPSPAPTAPPGDTDACPPLRLWQEAVAVHRQWDFHPKGTRHPHGHSSFGDKRATGPHPTVGVTPVVNVTARLWGSGAGQGWDGAGDTQPQQ